MAPELTDRSADRSMAPRRGTGRRPYPRLRQVLLHRRGEIFRQGRDLRPVRARLARHPIPRARQVARDFALMAASGRQHGARLHRAAGLAARRGARGGAQGAGRHSLVAARHLPRRRGDRAPRSSHAWSRRCAARPPSRHLRLSHRQRDSARHGALARARPGARLPQAPRRRWSRRSIPSGLVSYANFPSTEYLTHRFHRFPLLQRLSPPGSGVPPLSLAAAQSRGRPAAGADRVRHRFHARGRGRAGARSCPGRCGPPSRWASPAPSSSPGPTNGSPAAI